MSTSARTDILARIREAKHSTSQLAEAQAQWQQLPRDYNATPRPHEESIHLLIDRLRDYDAIVERITPAEAPAAITRVLAKHGSPSIVIPDGIPVELLPEYPFTRDANLSHDALDQLGGVLTTATLAIAETGTIVLQNAPGQGRRALSLVPDFHLCLVRESTVVDTVPQAFAALVATATLPTTFISGPSATADIEMTRIKGVHGPRFLHVLLLGS